MPPATYHINTSKRLHVILITIFGIWLGWLITTASLGRRVYLSEHAPDMLIILTLACVVGLFFAWRHLMRGALVAGNPFSLFKAFFFAAMMVMVTFWFTPDALVRLTADQKVSRMVAFSIEHPGPATARFSSCKAGMRFYDDDLQRTIFFCEDDKNVPPGSRRVEVEKHINNHGGRFLRYRFILADNSRSPWRNW
ncbi:DUF4010 domain-containing protein [Yokenella regensburgei]|uniref:hypothetical protein n=1 Tax=Yokenella regensburgei TaxID=158877 RepID=UPI003F152B72